MVYESGYLDTSGILFNVPESSEVRYGKVYEMKLNTIVPLFEPFITIASAIISNIDALIGIEITWIKIDFNEVYIQFKRIGGAKLDEPLYISMIVAAATNALWFIMGPIIVSLVYVGFRAAAGGITMIGISALGAVLLPGLYKLTMIVPVIFGIYKIAEDFGAV